MKRALLVAALAVASCRPGEPSQPAPPTPAPLPPAGREPTVRIGIAIDTQEVRIGGSVDFEIAVAGGDALARGRAGDAWTVRSRDGRLEARAADGRSIGPVDGSLRIRAEGATTTIGERPYRGEVLVLARPGDRVTAVNVLALEAYLLGVVPRELGRRPPSEIEAVKAQAVAARTYAVGNLGGRGAREFDFYATVQDQVYGGFGDEDSVSTRAVEETRGVVATWQGRPILAYYSSTCGGRTANIEDAWPWRSPLPYLRSVSDRVAGSDRSYCETSNRFRWSVRWTRRQLLDVLAQTLPATGRGQRPTRVQRVQISERSASGTVSVSLEADGTEIRLRADSLRWVLRPQPGPAILNSARLTDLEAEHEDGEVSGLRVDGMGWGHAVGMCQVGAIGRARAGQSYRDILLAYYSGIELDTLY